METKSVISTRTEDIEFSVPLTDDGESDWDALNYDLDDTELADLAKSLKVNVRLLRALRAFSDDVKESVGADLTDIWERLDRIEQAMRGD